MSMHPLCVGIFYLSGEPISLHLLRCGPFAVDYHSFMGQHLASTATSTRELSRLIQTQLFQCHPEERRKFLCLSLRASWRRSNLTKR